MITAGTSERLAATVAPVSTCKVIGLGNAGLAMIDRLVRDDGAPADVVAVHTDAKALSGSPAPRKL